MPRAKSKAARFKGPLAQPIDTGIVFPLNKDKWPEFREQDQTELRKQRMAKLTLLARHFGIEWDHLDLTKFLDQASFFSHLAIRLAIELGVPGFQRKNPGKWSPEIVMWTLVACERDKAEGKVTSDLPVCLEVVKGLYPEMGKRTNERQAKKSAMQLRNRVSELRARLKHNRAS